MFDSNQFSEWQIKRSRQIDSNSEYEQASLNWLNLAVESDYPYLFSWLGVPAIQFPSDLVLIQEAIFKSKANKIIEVGIGRGGTTIFLASLLSLIYRSENSSVVGIDIKISKHTESAIKNSIVNDKIHLIEGDSTNAETILKLRNFVNDDDKILVILDSNHTHEHVFAEMQIYGNLVSHNSYLIVMDTAIEYLEPELTKGKKWSRTNSPLSAIVEYQQKFPGIFVEDDNLNSRSLPGAAKGGFLRKV